jgi:predicted esterase
LGTVLQDEQDLRSSAHRRLALLALLPLACALPPRSLSDAAGGDGGRDSAVHPDAGATAAEARGPDAGVDPQLKKKLFDEVNAYLTAEDAGSSAPLLAKLETEYKSVPYSLLVEAVRHRPSPATFPATGVHQGTWVDPFYDGTETYHAYVPAALATSKSSTFPLLVFLHGAGGDGAPIANDPEVQKIADRLGTILVAPSCNKDCDWSYAEDCMSQVVYLIAHLKRRYPIDDDRVVLSGFSMGGRGSFSVGVAYPDVLAGLVPVAGSIGSIYATTDLAVHKKYCCPHVENARNLRLSYISGDQDNAYLIAQNRGCALCLEGLVSEWVYTELPGVGHSWPLTTWESAVAWTLAKARVRYPTTVVYNLAAQASSTFAGGLWTQNKLKRPQYWADIEARTDSTKPARLVASTYEGEGRIDLLASNVSHVTLYLADELLDDKGEVRVSLRRRAIYEGAVTLDRKFLLEAARRRGDRSRVFGASLSLDLE